MEKFSSSSFFFSPSFKNIFFLFLGKTLRFKMIIFIVNTSSPRHFFSSSSSLSLSLSFVLSL